MPKNPIPPQSGRGPCSLGDSTLVERVNNARECYIMNKVPRQKSPPLVNPSDTIARMQLGDFINAALPQSGYTAAASVATAPLQIL